MSPEDFARATTYPYRIPKRSFVFKDGREHPLAADDAPPDLTGRTPVLAVGSNQSPEQLARKYQGPGWGEIPVIRGRLRDFDSVYSPHIASYGAIAATLQHAPGVTVTLFVTWLTERQLARMHETEISSANYGYGRLERIALATELGPELDTVHIYNSRRGTLAHGGTPIPIAEIAAEGRSWRAMNQLEVQHHVLERLAPGQDLAGFIKQSVADADLRRERSDALKQGARPFLPPAFTEVPIG
jgi:hypothetical protein